MRRYIITGAPGAGKTTILSALRGRVYALVDEAATDVNLQLQALGHDEAWRNPGFIDAITLLQRERLAQPAPPATAVQVFDRSPICTLALARYLGLPVTPILARRLARGRGERLSTSCLLRSFARVHHVDSSAPDKPRAVSHVRAVPQAGIPEPRL